MMTLFKGLEEALSNVYRTTRSYSLLLRLSSSSCGELWPSAEAVFALWAKKLDGVGPVDNRPSTDKLHHFVRKEEEEKK